MEMEAMVRKEDEARISLSRLNVVVHPFSEGVQEKSLLAGDILARFEPQDTREITLVFPFGVSKNELKSQRRTHASLENGMTDWKTLLERMEADYEEGHVFALPDLLRYPNEAEKMIEVLGFKITPNTEIYFGGEYLQRCILNYATIFLSLPQVKRVFIDTNASKLLLGVSGDLNIQGFNITPHENGFIEISKPN